MVRRCICDRLSFFDTVMCRDHIRKHWSRSQHPTGDFDSSELQSTKYTLQYHFPHRPSLIVQYSKHHHRDRRTPIGPSFQRCSGDVQDLSSFSAIDAIFQRPNFSRLARLIILAGWIQDEEFSNEMFTAALPHFSARAIIQLKLDTYSLMEAEYASAC